MSEQTTNPKQIKAIALVTKGGRLHLAVADVSPNLRATASICGVSLMPTDSLSRVPQEDVAELHNFTLCSNCSAYYLHGGYRDFALASVAPDEATIRDAEMSRHRNGWKNQLALF